MAARQKKSPAAKKSRSREKKITENHWSTIQARTPGQKKYLDSIYKNTITFCCGEAGTGKSFLSAAMAIQALYNNKNDIRKIVVSRPVIEAGGERLGFLPGTPDEKLYPYLLPIYDSVTKIVGKDELNKLLAKDKIEIAPLAFMRGRDFENCFIILDEAQNASKEQLKMFLTRLGKGSKMVINGDMKQTDIDRKEKMGLLDAIERLQGLDEIGTVKLTAEDIVRHPLIGKILERYDE